MRRSRLLLQSQRLLVFFFFAVQRKRSKKKGQPDEALPLISNLKIQNSKGKPHFLLKTAPPRAGRSERFRLQGLRDRKSADSYRDMCGCSRLQGERCSACSHRNPVTRTSFCRFSEILPISRKRKKQKERTARRGVASNFKSQNPRLKKKTTSSTENDRSVRPTA